MATYELGPSSNSAVTLVPEYDYQKRVVKNESKLRTLSGKQYTYKWGSYTEFEFGLEYVAASDAAIVNSWFESNTELLFLITSSTATEVHSVMVQGEESPLAEYNKPYDNLFKGKIGLSTY